VLTGCSATPASSVASGQSITLPNSAANLSGSATFTCTDGFWGAAASDATCAYPIPVARFTVNNSAPIIGQEVVLDPSTSTIINGRNAPDVWNYDGGTLSTLQPAEFNKILRWTTAGTKSVSLTVTNISGSHTVTQNIIVSSFAPTGTLNDTGINWCSNGTAVVDPCSSLSADPALSQQDAFSGRDFALPTAKKGTGAAGFDFTKLAADGTELAASATSWNCVRDNTTQLIWEVNNSSANPVRDMTTTYTWANIQTPVTNVNALPAGQALCGFRDWRIPTVDELHNLANTGVINPAIDTNYFPNTSNTQYWTKSIYAGNSTTPLTVDFSKGYTLSSQTTLNANSPSYRVRLVRSGS